MSATTNGPAEPQSQSEMSDREVGDALIREGRKDPLREQRRQLAHDAKESVFKFADERKGQAASLLRDVSEALGAFTSKLEERGHDRTAQYAGVAAERLKRASEDLPHRDLGEMLRQVETFARERPAVFLGAMLVAGFGAARFLRTSAPAGQAAYDEDVGGGYAGYAGDAAPGDPAGPDTSRSGTGSAYHVG
jgi:hypothetical protein